MMARNSIWKWMHHESHKFLTYFIWVNERPEYYFSVAQHGSGREYTLCNKAISVVRGNMANFWVRESCVQKFIADSPKLRIGSNFLLAPPHKFASTSKIWLLKMSHKKAPFSEMCPIKISLYLTGNGVYHHNPYITHTYLCIPTYRRLMQFKSTHPPNVATEQKSLLCASTQPHLTDLTTLNYTIQHNVHSSSNSLIKLVAFQNLSHGSDVHANLVRRPRASGRGAWALCIVGLRAIAIAQLNPTTFNNKNLSTWLRLCVMCVATCLRERWLREELTWIMLWFGPPWMMREREMNNWDCNGGERLQGMWGGEGQEHLSPGIFRSFQSIKYSSLSTCTLVLRYLTIP